MAFRSSAGSSGINGTMSAPVPAGIQANDIIILFCSVDDTTRNFSTSLPSGFTLLDQQTVSADGQKVGVAWKRATGSETGTFAWTGSNTAYWACSAMLFSGRDTSNPPVISLANVVSAAHASPLTGSANGVTAVAGDDLAWVIGMDMVSNGSISTHSVTAPTGYTTQQNNAAANWSWTASATEDNVSAGATGTVSGTLTWTGAPSAGYAGWLIRIPAAASSGSLDLGTITSGASALGLDLSAGAATLSLAAVSSGASAFGFNLSAGPATQTLGTITSGASAFGFNLSPGPATQTLGTITSGSSAFGLNLAAGAASLALGTITSGAVAFGLSVGSLTSNIALGTIASGASAFGFSLSAGPATQTLGTITSGASAFGFNLSPGPATQTLGTITSGASAFGFNLTPGAATLPLGAVASTSASFGLNIQGSGSATQTLGTISGSSTPFGLDLLSSGGTSTGTGGKRVLHIRFSVYH